ncbi:MAG: RNA dependent RNA polymerase, partial [Bacilli bacterium]
KELLHFASTNVKVEVLYRTAEGEVSELIEGQQGFRFERYTIVNPETEQKIVISVVPDVINRIKESDKTRFLVRKVDANLDLVGIEEFKQWDVEAASNILDLEVTDGSGWVAPGLVQGFSEMGLIRNGALQVRSFASVKGALLPNAEITKLFGSNIVLPHSMVKENNVLPLLSEVFSLWSVGQRSKDDSGAMIASQATLLMGLTSEEMKSTVDALIAEEIKNFNEGGNTPYARAMEKNALETDRFLMSQRLKQFVEKLNELFMSKTFVKDAKAKFMFADPIAIYNAYKDGRTFVTEADAVIGIGEAVTAKEGKLRTGKLVALRYPLGMPHHISVLMAKEYAAFNTMAEDGHLDEVILFSVLGWDAVRMSGADFDGDMAIVIFDAMIVAAVEKQQSMKFAGLPVLPMPDCYISEDGAIAGKGCPEFGQSKKEESIEIVNGVIKHGNTLYYDNSIASEAIQSIHIDTMKKLTVSSIEKSSIGIVVNWGMIAQAMRWNGIKLDAEDFEIQALEEEILYIAVAAEWEVDRPKHGGAYEGMTVFKELFRKYRGEFVNEEDFNQVVNPIMKQAYNKKLSLKKPQWMADQKYSNGEQLDDVYAKTLDYATDAIVNAVSKLVKDATSSFKAISEAVNFRKGETSLPEDAIVELLHLVEYNKVVNSAISSARRKFEDDVLKPLSSAKHEKMPKAVKLGYVRNVATLESSKFTMLSNEVSDAFKSGIYAIAAKHEVDVRVVVAEVFSLLKMLNTEKKDASQVELYKDGINLGIRVSGTNMMHSIYTVMESEFTQLLEANVDETPLRLTQDVKPSTNTQLSVKVQDGGEKVYFNFAAEKIKSSSYKDALSVSVEETTMGYIHTFSIDGHVVAEVLTEDALELSANVTFGRLSKSIFAAVEVFGLTGNYIIPEKEKDATIYSDEEADHASFDNQAGSPAAEDDIIDSGEQSVYEEEHKEVEHVSTDVDFDESGEMTDSSVEGAVTVGFDASRLLGGTVNQDLLNALQGLKK